MATVTSKVRLFSHQTLSSVDYSLFTANRCQFQGDSGADCTTLCASILSLILSQCPSSSIAISTNPPRKIPTISLVLHLSRLNFVTTAGLMCLLGKAHLTLSGTFAHGILRVRLSMSRWQPSSTAQLVLDQLAPRLGQGST